ncbi:MAG: hypothetical protein KJN95_00080, partial [Gammaproteobacteria bacterium]|nr:hypothetical protein [Gammaproteobacteria bacterium]
MHNNSTALDHTVLKRIRNLALFNDKQLNSLATRLEPKIAAPKQRIIGLGDLGDYSLYLLSGEAISRDGEGNERKMDSENQDNLEPIAHIRPSLYEVETVSPAKYLE